MLDINFIKENRAIVESAITNKKGEPVDLDQLFQLFDDRKKLQQELDEVNRGRKAAAETRDIEAGTQLKSRGQKLEEELREVEKDFVALMVKIPNIPSPDTPIGASEEDNVVVRQVGDKPTFDFTPKAHWDLGPALGVIDNETAAQVSGARFTYLKGNLALLQFALLQHAFAVLTNKELLEDIASRAGIKVPVTAFTPVVPPVMVKPAVLNRMARLEPREDRFYIESDDLFLVGSAEHTLGPMHMDTMFDEAELPIRYVGYSTSFRREAGSYGKDTKGILRMHQFDKLEIETFVLPEYSYAEQDFIVAVQEHLMQSLQLPYQVVAICTGDMGGPDQRQFDIETWMPGQDAYRETQTSDFMGGYQARRLNTRVKRADGKKEHVHMNDATVFAIGRTLIAIMENYQQADGSIAVPQVLRPYMFGNDSISPAR